MKKFIVFDNGGKTSDRFTIINKETGDVFGAGENQYDAESEGTFCGNLAAHKVVLLGAGWRQKMPLKKVIHAEVENYVNNARLSPDWIGVEVSIKSLPESVRRYIAGLDNHTDAAQHKEKVPATNSVR